MSAAINWLVWQLKWLVSYRGRVGLKWQFCFVRSNAAATQPAPKDADEIQSEREQACAMRGDNQ